MVENRAGWGGCDHMAEVFSDKAKELRFPWRAIFYQTFICFSKIKIRLEAEEQQGYYNSLGQQ